MNLENLWQILFINEMYLKTVVCAAFTESAAAHQVYIAGDRQLVIINDDRCGW